MFTSKKANKVQWGFPLTVFDMKLILKLYLDTKGKARGFGCKTEIDRCRGLYPREKSNEISSEFQRQTGHILIRIGIIK